MTPDHVRRLSRVLAAQVPGEPPLQFAYTPNDGEGPYLLVDADRVDPLAKLELVRRGARNLVEGTVERTPDGFLVFRSPGLNDKRLASLVAALSPRLPIVEGARLG
jgi:hypothetical protein